MKRFVRIALKTGVPFGVFMGIFLAIQDNIEAGVSGGLFLGIFFGLAMASLEAFISRGFANNPPSFTDEILITDGPANHFMNGEGVGGWLYLTDKRLFFRSHKANVQVHELSVPIHEIEEIAKAKRLGIISNRLQLVLKHGEKELFVVEKVSDWIDRIEDSRSKYLDYHESPQVGLFG